METEEIPIRYVDWGLANNFGDYIELNKELKNDWRLREYVLAHELGHKKGFDLAHEFKWNKNLPRLIKFVLINPKTWIDLLPIQYKNKTFIYDINIGIMYIIIIVLILFLIKIF